MAPISIEEGGLRTYDGFGLPAFVEWQKVKRIRRISFGLGVKWLLLDDGRPFLKLAGMPVFVEDKADVLRQVKANAGAEHVLTRALEKNGF